MCDIIINFHGFRDEQLISFKMEHYLQALMPKDSQESDQGWFAKAVGAVSSDVEATFRLFVILNSLSTQVEIASSVSGIVSISST